MHGTGGTVEVGIGCGGGNAYDGVGRGVVAGSATEDLDAEGAFLGFINGWLISGITNIQSGPNMQTGVSASPGWQFTLLDSSFEGQREAAIQEHEAGLTLVRDEFRNVPTAVSIDAGYAEELWMQGVRLEDISGPALAISNERNERTEIHAQDIGLP